MEAALGWLGELMQWVAMFFPRIVHVNCTHNGVRFVRGKQPKLVKPGLRLYWPISTELVVWPVIIQVLRLKTQSLRTRDHTLLELEVLVAYTIGDLVQFISDLHDPEQAVADYCLGAARQVVCSRTIQELEQDHAATDQSLVEEIRKLVHQHGVRVKRARFVSMAPMRALKVFGLSSPTSSTEDSEYG